jgi:hypothetical protein
MDITLKGTRDELKATAALLDSGRLAAALAAHGHQCPEVNVRTLLRLDENAQVGQTPTDELLPAATPPTAPPLEETKEPEETQAAVEEPQEPPEELERETAETTSTYQARLDAVVGKPRLTPQNLQAFWHDTSVKTKGMLCVLRNNFPDTVSNNVICARIGVTSTSSPVRCITRCAAEFCNAEPKAIMTKITKGIQKGQRGLRPEILKFMDQHFDAEDRERFIREAFEEETPEQTAKPSKGNRVYPGQYQFSLSVREFYETHNIPGDPSEEEIKTSQLLWVTFLEMNNAGRMFLQLVGERGSEGATGPYLRDKLSTKNIGASCCSSVKNKAEKSNFSTADFYQKVFTAEDQKNYQYILAPQFAEIFEHMVTYHRDSGVSLTGDESAAPPQSPE